MPRRNRLSRFAELHATPERGTLWANRGPLLDATGRLARHHAGRGWVICVLAFKDRRRDLWRPGRLTELFVLDEATGLAAVHRPCGECCRADHVAFKAAWAAAYPGTDASAPGIDAGHGRDPRGGLPAAAAPVRRGRDVNGRRTG